MKINGLEGDLFMDERELRSIRGRAVGREKENVGAFAELLRVHTTL
jgi:hypothetical protein